MPDTASEIAIAKLGIKVCNESNNCTIVLKEVGKEGNLKYVVMANKEKKFLFWQWKSKVSAEVDAKTGILS